MNIQMTCYRSNNGRGRAVITKTGRRLTSLVVDCRFHCLMVCGLYVIKNDLTGFQSPYVRSRLVSMKTKIRRRFFTLSDGGHEKMILILILHGFSRGYLQDLI